jgi:hypothetical protein
MGSHYQAQTLNGFEDFPALVLIAQGQSEAFLSGADQVANALMLLMSKMWKQRVFMPTAHDVLRNKSSLIRYEF